MFSASAESSPDPHIAERERSVSVTPSVSNSSNVLNLTDSDKFNLTRSLLPRLLSLSVAIKITESSNATRTFPTISSSTSFPNETDLGTTPESAVVIPVYVVVVTAVLLIAMTSTLLYFLCRCIAKKKRREHQLANITPKMPNPRLAGVCANHPIQFVVPKTVIITETTEDSMSETDYYSSSSAKTLPIVTEGKRRHTSSAFRINPEDLQHGLYVGINAASERGAFLGDLGKIGFSLRYDITRNQLTVRLIGASDLPCLFLKTTANPYAKVVLLPDRSAKYFTKVQRNTMNPAFNETFVFSVVRSELNEKKLKISVWDYDRFSRKCLIGQIVYSVKDSGITNALSVDTTTGDIWVDLKQESFSHSGGNAEMLFSLCYNPDSANLTLTVLKVRGLIMADKGKDTAVYAKVTLYVRRKLVRTKKTSSKRKTPEMEFNNTFNVRVPQSALNDIDLLVTLCEKPQGIGNKRMLGRTQVGANCLCDQGLQHWQDMMLSPKSTCAQWHVMY